MVTPLGLPQEPIYLLPGELLITHASQEIVTVLGSCVTVTMFNAQFGVASICHGMLPQPSEGDVFLKDAPGRFKYLSEAIPMMYLHFKKLGIVSEQIEVKLFGGANLLSGDVSQAEHGPDRLGKMIGFMNIKHARQLLEASSLKIAAANIGGTRGRKIVFHTRTGHVLHRHLIQVPSL